MTNNYLKVEIENNVATVTIDRESKLNALNVEVLREMKSVFIDLAKLNLEELKAVIVTGAGQKAFIAGADIAVMSDMDDIQGFEFAKLGQEVSLLIENFNRPVVAAVHGYAMGGGLEVALSCDFIFTTEQSSFALPEVKLGLIPGFGGTQRLAKYIGAPLAKYFIFSGQTFKAQQALQMGLVVGIFQTKEQMIDEIKKYLNTVTNNSSLAIAKAKDAINKGISLKIEEGLEKESTHFSTLFSSYDMKEGTQAFIQKRVPQFKGR